MENNKKIVYTDPETGRACIVHPTPEWLSIEGNTLELCAQKSVPEGLPYRIVDEDKIPEDRTFRNAWTDEYDTETVDIHMDKAKDIHLDRLREQRNEQLSKLDKAYMISLERGLEEEVKKVAETKQLLRDMPLQARKDMEEIDSVEDLKNYVPDVLKE